MWTIIKRPWEWGEGGVDLKILVDRGTSPDSQNPWSSTCFQTKLFLKFIAIFKPGNIYFVLLRMSFRNSAKGKDWSNSPENIVKIS